MEEHPQGTEEMFLQYCEEIIPTMNYPAYCWLIELSVDWYRYQSSSPLPFPDDSPLKQTKNAKTFRQ